MDRQIDRHAKRKADKTTSILPELQSCSSGKGTGSLQSTVRLLQFATPADWVIQACLLQVSQKVRDQK